MDRLLRNRTLAHVAGVVGILGQLAAGFSFILGAGLMVPPPATYVFFVAGIVLVVLSVAWWRDHPWRSFLLPIVSIPAVTVVLALGGLYLDWGG